MTDRQFLKFLETRNQLLEERYKRDINPPQGLGNSVKGSVFDCNRKSFERLLKEEDPNLFLVWNPTKNSGFGCWQIWINPLQKSLVHKADYEGNSISSIEYRFIPVEHHIMDLPVLDYSVIEKLKKSRVTVEDIMYQDYEARRKLQKEKDSYLDDRKHAIKQTKQYWKAFKDHVQSGYNPMWFFDQHRKIQKEGI